MAVATAQVTADITISCVTRLRKRASSTSLFALAICGALSAILFTQNANANRLLLKAKADQSTGTPSLYQPEKTYKHYKQFSIYIPMEDGTKIATEIYLPSPLPAGTKLPTIFEQSRYWRVIEPRFPFNKIYSKILSLFRDEFISHGYAWVAIDTRGGGASFGSRPWDFGPLDIADSKEIIEWITKQNWSDGKIGVIGHSYSGNLAELSLLSKLPAVKAAAVFSSPFDLYADVLRPGGMELEPFISAWADLTKKFDNNKLPKSIELLSPILKGIRPIDDDKSHSQIKQALSEHSKNPDLTVLSGIRFKDDYVFGDAQNKPQAFINSVELLRKHYGENFKVRGIELGSPSGYWQEVNAVKVPIYAGAGWLEGSNANAAIDRFINYSTPGSKLILGPWDHNLFNISPFTRGGPTKFKLDGETLKFFDHNIKGIDEGISRDSAVNYFTMGEEKWHGISTWPPVTTTTSLYLDKSHALSASKPGTASGDNYKINFDATTGKYSRWDCMLGRILLSPYPDRVKADKKLLLYTGAPLAENINVTGSPSCKLYLESNGSDCALFAYLEDVSPNGAVTYVTEGEVLSGNRVSDASALSYKSMLPARSYLRKDYQRLKPQETIQIEIGMLPTSYQFKKGHKIRLAIAGADKAHFRLPKDVKPGTAFRMHRGGETPSVLDLPVEPAERHAQ